ncbi:methylated-DNA--[protein]-cysteine S-methyltransferase [Marinoscillum furvescens]|uniref:methylated-DNA--[protein]-cysteine S-methyltransferase n=1 Tax=Marinoscillum furvescens DSM 4134 TaxID=1122208 RepID=A0A3D9L3M2_MARFU|nr:methylated-DNA--[protein]-cysteine S-methyltransferase [Marinoscillum furvescens]RED97971.1 O-6-methylguanine DNA methyltransferase [Marinoscillum furvescens DSM 4134]
MTIQTTRIHTPLGDMVAGAVDSGICLLEFHDRRMLPTQEKRITSLLKSKLQEGHHPHFDTLRNQLAEYFEQKRTQFDVPITYPGSAFQQKVWQSLLKIPYGKVHSYAQQSELLGDKKAIRAMAKANGDNRLAILIPCHRVIGSDGSLVGYGGKLWRKKALLELEGALPKTPELFA